MKFNQAATFCGVTLLMVSGIIGGQFAVHHYFLAGLAGVANDSTPGLNWSEFQELPDGTTVSTAVIPDELAHLYIEGVEPPGSSPASLHGATSNCPSGACPSQRLTLPPTQTAELYPPFAKANSDGPRFPEPKALPAPVDAAPLQETPTEVVTMHDEAALRALILKHMPGSSSEEVDIWAQELKDCDLSVVREMLQLRKLADKAGTPREPAIAQVPMPNDGETPAPFAASTPAKANPHFDPNPGIVLPNLDAVTVKSAPPEPPAIDRLQPTIAAFQQAFDVILNNIANADSIGFKRTEVDFQDLPYETLQIDELDDDAFAAAPQIAIGLGTEVAATSLNLAQGELVKTERAFDLAIQGAGFFQLKSEEETCFTRCGRFRLTTDGGLALTCGQQTYLLEPTLKIPEDATAVTIAADGLVTWRKPGQEQPTECGRIQIVRFLNAAALEPIGSCLYGATAASGTPRIGSAGLDDPVGQIQQSHLERSNVDCAAELHELDRLADRLTTLRSAAATIRRAIPESALPANSTYESIAIPLDEGAPPRK